MANENECPVTGDKRRHMSNQDWWPNSLNVKVLHQNSTLSDPMGKEFNYAKEF